MAKTHKVNVLAEDFELGEKKNSNRCAVKRAVARDIPGAKRVEVDLQTIRFSLDGERHVFLTPWTVADYVIAYDAGDEDELQPFSFQLRPSAEVGSKVRRQVFTEEGKKVDNARNKIRKAEARKEKARDVLANPDSWTPVQIAQAEETLATIDGDIKDLKSDYEALREELRKARKPRLKRVDTDLPQPPRKTKTRTRNFGMRELRVNQKEGRTHTPSVAQPR